MVMEKKWIKDLGAYECINAPTKEISDKLCKKFDELGLTWSDGSSYIKDDYFFNYGAKINYIPFSGTFCFTDYAKSNFKVYTINDLLDFDGENFDVSDEGYTKEEIELLDRFAGLAMQSEMLGSSESHMADKAERAYKMAYWMLKARKEALKNV